VRRLALALAALAAAALIYVGWLWWGPGPLSKPSSVTIEEGTAVGGAAGALAKAGAIRDRTTFYYFARLIGSGDPIQAGEFEIPARASASAILGLLQHGRPVQRLITVTEGMPSVMVGERLAANQFLSGPVPAIAEGSVLPNSYSFERGEARAAVAGRMQAAMAKTLNQLWPTRTGACPVSTQAETVILASIVEKETGKPSERPMIAGVYCNRLRIGMKLDADPTVIYPVTKGKPLGRRIRRSELMADNGYNTYRRAGLPNGPIANPGRDSIAAVLRPASTKALYFVADGTGGHVFAETLQQHQANVAKWYALRRQRGEM
jgi:UPF0755 protein